MVVAVVAVLATIGSFGYLEHVTRAQRAEARSALMEMASRLERYYFYEHSYTTDLTEIGYGAGDDAASTEGRYTLSAAAGSTGDITTSFVLTATDTTGDDDACPTLTFDWRGNKGPGAECWR